MYIKYVCEIYEKTVKCFNKILEINSYTRNPSHNRSMTSCNVSYYLYNVGT